MRSYAPRVQETGLIKSRSQDISSLIPQTGAFSTNSS
jgi:hypothetical protein